jgi:hypothetical protein
MAPHDHQPGHRSHRAHRLIRQVHLWIGAWGALAAIVFGFSVLSSAYL